MPDRKLTFEWIDPARLHGCWELIRLGLLKIVPHSTDRWIPEDIYMAIRTGTAHLHLGTRDGQYAGFLVTQKQQAWDGQVLHVWCAYSASEDDVLHDGMDQIKEWAQNMAATRITFASPRAGWEKVAPKYGFKPAHTIFEMEV
jgi:hypothetical protein